MNITTGLTAASLALVFSLSVSGYAFADNHKKPDNHGQEVKEEMMMKKEEMKAEHEKMKAEKEMEKEKVKAEHKKMEMEMEKEKMKKEKPEG